MGKKQKKMLARILVSAVLFAAGFVFAARRLVTARLLSYGLRNHRVGHRVESRTEYRSRAGI